MSAGAGYWRLYRVKSQYQQDNIIHDLPCNVQILTGRIFSQNRHRSGLLHLCGGGFCGMIMVTETHPITLKRQK